MPYKNTESKREWQKQKRHLRKKELQQYKSNKKCAICGYNSHTEILQFHHKNKKQKSFDFSGGNIGNRSQKTIQKEIDKCLLLCPNCHQWLHYQEKDDFFTKVATKWKIMPLKHK